MEVRNNYINGRWQASVSGATREVINPSNGEVIALVTDSVAEDSKQRLPLHAMLLTMTAAGGAWPGPSAPTCCCALPMPLPPAPTNWR
jgi:hypothetical protein